MDEVIQNSTDTKPPRKKRTSRRDSVLVLFRVPKFAHRKMILYHLKLQAERNKKAVLMDAYTEGIIEFTSTLKFENDAPAGHQ